MRRHGVRSAALRNVGTAAPLTPRTAVRRSDPRPQAWGLFLSELRTYVIDGARPSDSGRCARRVPACAMARRRPLTPLRSPSMSTTGWIILGVIVVLVLWIIMIYNQLVAMRQRVDQSFADIDVQLKQRHDLIPNLVETVKGYAAHERGTLEAVVKARNAAIAAPGPGAAGRGREHAVRRAAPAVRAVGGLSGPQGQPELPAAAEPSCPTSRTRSRRRGASSTTRCRSTTPASSSSRPRCSPARSASASGPSSTSARSAPWSRRRRR